MDSPLVDLVHPSVAMVAKTCCLEDWRVLGSGWCRIWTVATRHSFWRRSSWARCLGQPQVWIRGRFRSQGRTSLQQRDYRAKSKSGTWAEGDCVEHLGQNFLAKYTGAGRTPLRQQPTQMVRLGPK